jgi:hypothetical protein
MAVQEESGLTITTTKRKTFIFDWGKKYEQI